MLPAAASGTAPVERLVEELVNGRCNWRSPMLLLLSLVAAVGNTDAVLRIELVAIGCSHAPKQCDYLYLLPPSLCLVSIQRKYY